MTEFKKKSTDNLDTPCIAVDVVGERHTGTNYLQQIFNQNLGCPVVRNTVPQVLSNLPVAREVLIDSYFRVAAKFGIFWKHRFLHEWVVNKRKQERCGIVCIVRDPLAWLVSLRRKPYHSNRIFNCNLLDFSKELWHTRWRDSLNTNLLPVLKLYELKVNSYLDNKKHENVIIVRYEDLTCNPEEQLDLICSTFHLSRVGGAFRDFNTSTKNDSRSSVDFIKAIRQRDWLKEYKKNEEQVILNNLDSKILEKLNYPF